jgi:hypothetical protein
MSLRPRLAEETPFTLEFDSEVPETIYAMELGWGDDPMQLLMRKQELERDELTAYMLEHLH